MAEEVKLPKDASAKTLTGLSIVPLKKHKGKTVLEVLKEDPGYILWAENNVSFLRFEPSILEQAQAAVSGGTTSFLIIPEELQKHAQILHDLSQGLDSVPTNGVRSVHGIPQDVNVHRTLDYFRHLSRHVLAQEQAKEANREV